jgi:pimeloyl-ACP methyl ester carboxylesterase
MFKRLFLFLIVITAITCVSAQTYQTPQDLADPDGQFLDIDGISIYVQLRGEPENPAVILIHGFGGSTFTWRGTLDPLVEAGYYAIALDLPPFGLSDKSADIDYSRSALSDLVAGVMDELGIENAVIVGHSMGGGVTASLGVRHSDRVRGLVFVAGGVFEAMPVSDTSDDGERGGGLSDLSGFMDTLDPESPFAAALVRTFLTPERFTDLLESAYVRKEVITSEVIAGYQRPLLIEDWPQGLLAFSAAEETSPITLDDLAAAVTENDIPVLIIWGESDEWVSIALGETMHAALSDSVMVVRKPSMPI